MVRADLDRCVDTIRTLFRLGVLGAGLAAMLLFGFDRAIPLPRAWALWTWPLAIGSMAGVGGLIVWPSGSEASRSSTADGLALVLGLSSMILGLAATLLIPYGFALRIAEERLTAHVFLFRMTHPWVVGYMMAVAGIVALPGILAIGVARRGGREVGRASAAAVAVRFSRCGLICSMIVAAACVAGQAYRLLTWGWIGFAA